MWNILSVVWSGWDKVCGRLAAKAVKRKRGKVMPDITDINKTYGEHRVLEHFSLHIEEGRTTCIMGRSGCGKTTLLRILMGLEQADEDFGRSREMAAMKKSAVFQEDRLCENLSVMANIRLTCPDRTKAQIQEEMREVDLEGCAGQPVHELSGGMKRRVALLRALLAPGDILFLDEPFKGLDEETRQKVIAYTARKCQGRTVLFVTHDEREARLMKAAAVISMEALC